MFREFKSALFWRSLKFVSLFVIMSLGFYMGTNYVIAFYGRTQTPQLNIQSSARLSSSSSSSSSSQSSSTSSSQRKHQLLLVTKGRSGSSFTSALINDNPDVFYSFEPLYVILRAKDEIKQERVHGIIKSHLNCDFMNISAKDLDQNFHMRTSYGKRFVTCERKQNNGFAHIQCLSDFVKVCRSRDMSFTKLIRLPMKWAEPLLRELPNLKILYLIRDPRAVIYSQSLHFHNFKWPDGLDKPTATFCDDLKDDFNEIDRLKTLFPDRLLVIRYENGATDPIRYTQNIYKFIGLNFTNKTKEYISYLQNPDKKEDSKTYGLRRSNATKVVNKWRTSQGGLKAAKIIDELCGDVYEKAGYVKVASEEHLLDTPKRLFTDPAKFYGDVEPSG